MKLLLPVKNMRFKPRGAQTKKLVRCTGCGQLYADTISFRDHAMFCEVLKENDEFISQKG